MRLDPCRGSRIHLLQLGEPLPDPVQRLQVELLLGDQAMRAGVEARPGSISLLHSYAELALSGRGDIDAGEVNNSVEATAYDPQGDPATDTDTNNYTQYYYKSQADCDHISQGFTKKYTSCYTCYYSY